MSDLFLLGCVGITGFLCQLIAWRSNIPAIIFYLVAGIVLGPVMGTMKPDELFGDLLFPMVSLAVAVILFEGSLTLRFAELKDVGSSVVTNMVSYAALVEAVIIAALCHYLLAMEWPISALFGAMMVVTGPTVIIPMLNSVKPKIKIAKVLRWEGVVIDPLGSLLAVLVFEWIIVQHSNQNLAHVFTVFAQTILVGLATGSIAGYLTGLCLRHHWVPEHLQNFFVVALVAFVFSLSDSLMHESGLLTVTIMGIFLANMRDVHIRDILNFKEHLSVILVAILFIILAARVDLRALYHLGFGALMLLIAMQLFSRPFKVMIATIGSSFTFKERFVIGWIGPRGIVAAAVSSVFAIKLQEIDMPQSDLLVPLTFTVIIGTVVIQSATARPLARLLEATEPDHSGFLIIGANRVAIKIAEALKTANINCILCDTYWENISAARMKGLSVYHGDPSSEHAELNLELGGVGGLLGLSKYRSENTTASLRFRERFGMRNIYILAAPEDEKQNDKYRVSRHYKGRVLFRDSLHYNALEARINDQTQIKRTQLTDEYTFEDWLADNRNNDLLLLFALDEHKHLHWNATDKNLSAKEGWVLFSLYQQVEYKKKQLLKQGENAGDEASQHAADDHVEGGDLPS